MVGKGLGNIKSLTDDAMVVETMLKRNVKLVEGSYENIKITTPEDLKIAEIFVRAATFSNTTCSHFLEG